MEIKLTNIGLELVHGQALLVDMVRTEGIGGKRASRGGERVLPVR